MNPREAIRAFDRKPDRAYVGFSGGADSTALLLSMHLEGWKVTAVHFNHHLRGAESDADEAWCRKFCEERRIQLKVFDLWVERDRRPGEGVEEAARRLRLEVWKRLVAEHWQMIFLAHHADDCLEELFLRLGRGSNVSGLTSLRPERELDGLTLCRPFLQLRKRNLEEWLREQGIEDWRVDQTNLDAYTSRRNAIRNRLLPLVREIFGTDAGVLAALQSLREDAECLEKTADDALNEDWRSHKGEWENDWSPVRFWRKLPTAVLVRALRTWTGLEYPLSRRTIERLVKAVKAGKDGMLPLGKGLCAQIDGKELTFFDEKIRNEERRKQEIEWTSTYEPWYYCNPLGDWPSHVEDDFFFVWNNEGVTQLVTHHRFAFWVGDRFDWNGGDAPYSDDGHWCEYFDEDKISHLDILSSNYGDGRLLIQPLGMGGHHKKLAKFFHEQKIPVEERIGWPLVYNEVSGTNRSELIWVPGVCRSEFGKVTKTTKTVVRLHCHSFNINH